MSWFARPVCDPVLRLSAWCGRCADVRITAGYEAVGCFVAAFLPSSFPIFVICVIISDWWRHGMGFRRNLPVIGASLASFRIASLVNDM